MEHEHEYQHKDQFGNHLWLDELMSVTDYAAYRKRAGLPGGSRTAVYKAIKTGRIETLKCGLISANMADRMWRERTQIRMGI